MGARQWLARLTTRLSGAAAEAPSSPAPASDPSVIPASALEDLAGLLLKAAGEDIDVEELCACAARLSHATGCAVMEWDDLAGEARIHAAVGTWEENPLRPCLEGTTPEWAFALGGAPVCACCEERTVRAFRWSKGPESAASGLAMPIRVGEQMLGALLYTYPAPRMFTPEEVRVGRLVACHAALVLRHRALAATVELQAKRIARLVDDVERMLIALRRAAARADGDGRA
jgi:GAF domain-containing protein